MTVASELNRKEYAGNGVTTAFATSPMVFFDASDLEVYDVLDSTGVATLQTITTHYTVSGGAGSTGTVTMLTAPASGHTLVIVRSLPLTQEDDFVQNDASDAEVVEDAFDRQTMVAQQLQARVDRSVRLPDGDVSGANTELPPPEALTVPGWNAAGDGMTNYPVQTGTSLVDLAASSGSSLVGFIQSGTGATAGTLQDEARRTVYPEQFGCVGDGVTDDSVNMALAATRAAGGTLRGQTGKTYLIAGVDVPAAVNGTIVDMTGCVVKSKILATTVGSPIFNGTGTGELRFKGGIYDGQKASQPADGFSDSYKGGANGIGRSYRAAIKADASIATGLTKLVVDGVAFKDVFGSPVAALNMPTAIQSNCEADNCNFELGYFDSNVASLDYCEIKNNRQTNVGTGDGSVNANGFFAVSYDVFRFDGNTADTLERDLLKVANCDDVELGINTVRNISVESFSGIQYIVQNGKSASRFVNGVLNCFNVGSGLFLNGESGNGTLQYASCGVINVVKTNGTTTPDGFISTLDIDTLIIDAANLSGIVRHGLNIQNRVRTLLKIKGGSVRGDSGGIGVFLQATGGNWGTVDVSGIVSDGFVASDGTFVLQRSSSNIFAKLIARDNTIIRASTADNGLVIASDIVTVGVVSDNFVDGKLIIAAPGILTKDNIATGTTTLPAKTFTPTLTFGGAAVDMTGTFIGQYKVKDRRCYFDIHIILTAKGSSTGAASIGGLPFASNIVSNYVAHIGLTATNLTFSGVPTGNIVSNSSAIALVQFASGGALAVLTDAGFANNTDLRLSGSYDIASGNA